MPTHARYAILAVSWALVCPQAQVNFYCNSRIVANAFYADVQSNGRTSVATYFG